MNAILILVFQIIFGVVISGTALNLNSEINEDQVITTQEIWRENFKDVAEEMIYFVNNITTFAKDWASLNESIHQIKNKLINKNKINFEIKKNEWPETNQKYNVHGLSDSYICDSILYKETETSIIQDQYTILLTTLTKPLDMHENYIIETLESLTNQVTILKELLPFKLRYCSQILNCTVERTEILDELKRNKMVFEDLKGKTINILEILRKVNYNINKQKYKTRTELTNLKNKYACCTLKKITCVEVSNDMDTFEPLDFESLMPKLKENNFQNPLAENHRTLTLRDFLNKPYDNNSSD